MLVIFFARVKLIYPLNFDIMLQIKSPSQAKGWLRSRRGSGKNETF
ncbi:MAG: hypothetical protein LBB23_03730 [Rickettsiales bacterium]|nr:hypothetical protein [Rickettsiales bacterium]